MESKRTVFKKDMLAASATTTASVQQQHNRALLLQGRRHKMTEEALRKGSLPEAPVLLEGKIKKRADMNFKETVRIRRMIVGILPSVKKIHI